MANITLYSTGRPRCNVLKKKLAAKNIEYILNDSVSDMEVLGITQVPVLQIGDELLSFSQANQWINEQG